MECFIAEFHDPYRDHMWAKIYGIGPGSVVTGRGEFVEDARKSAGAGQPRRIVYARYQLHFLFEELREIRLAMPDNGGEDGRACANEMADLLKKFGVHFHLEYSDFVPPLIARTRTPVIKFPDDRAFYAPGAMSGYACALAFFGSDNCTVEIFHDLEEAIECSDGGVVAALREARHYHTGDAGEILINAGVIEIN